MENMNTNKYLEEMKNQVLSILSCVSPVSTQIHTGQAGTTIIPSDAMDIEEDKKIEQDKQVDTKPNSHIVTNHEIMKANTTIQ